MNFSEFFIRRRIATLLVALGAMALGIVAYFALPVAPLPQIETPTISVSANLPGASATTMATSVASPLERQLSQISGVDEMTSASSLGSTNVTLVFDLDKPIQEAVQDVQTAINAAGGYLPKNLPNPPTYHKTNPGDVTLFSMTLSSSTIPLIELGRLSDEFILKQLARIPGVGQIEFRGMRKPAVRVQLDPDKVAALGLTLADVRQVIASATINAPKGTLSGADRTVTLDTNDQLIDADAYRSLVIASRDGQPIRLSDVGTVANAPEDTRSAAWSKGKPCIIIDVRKQPGYNVVNTIAAIRAALPGIIAQLPPAAHLEVASDRAQTIRAAVDDVQLTMLLTVALVVLVIFAFLQNVRATIISSIAIPLSVIATFAAMYLLGYSLDNLSLMALTIAVSFVVDDAIVVIENVARHLDEGKSKLQAAIDGSREIMFTIISMTVSLIAVFIPILLMGGIIGRLFREFAVTVSIALIISALVSLTVTPMLCAWLFDHLPADRQGPLQRRAEAAIEGMTDFYRRTLDAVLRVPSAMLIATLLTLALTIYCYIVIPKGFFPQTDTGLISAVVEAAPDVGYDAMAARMQKAISTIEADPDVDRAYGWVGMEPTLSQTRISVALKPHAERRSGAADVAKRLRKATNGIDGLDVHYVVRQDVNIGGRLSKAQYQYTLQSTDIDQLTDWSNILQQKMKKIPALEDVTSDAQRLATSANLEVDRTTASRLGISVQAIDDALYDAFGQRQVATLFTQLSQYHVVQEIDPKFQIGTGALDHLYVRSSITNKLVPLSLVTRVVSGVAPITINHDGGYPSITLSFNLAPGHSLGEAVQAVNDLEAQLDMPSSIHGSFAGTAAAFEDSLASQPYLIFAAVVAVYIVLGILYESAIHPLTIISTLPSAGLGALLALMLFGEELSIMGLIGIILLIGIVKKNAIMMIDFALAAEREGLPAAEAIRQGAVLRFRPIMMTTAAAFFGALPLAFGIGQGSEPRIPLGIAIAGGLIVSQALTLYATPVIYILFDRLAARFRRSPEPSLQTGSPAFVD